jgi:hypothetical protein
MTQQFLRRFEIDARCSKVRCERMAEAVPADRLSFDPSALDCGTDDFLE